MNKEIQIKPYARLLTMLGDQLIKNEQIAVIELIKNSYDADADWVKVSFDNFGNNWKVLPESTITIDDNGCGMTDKIIEMSWMNPATPNKVGAKCSKIKKRIIQGEKGIGRYAMLKLGKTIQMTTRPIGGEKEYSLCLDFNEYDENFLVEDKESDKKSGLFLDALKFKLQETDPIIYIGQEVVINGLKFSDDNNAHGTRLVISNLRGSWSQKKVENIKESFVRFGNVFDEIIEEDKPKKEKDHFEIGLYCGDEVLTGDDTKNSRFLKNLFDEKAVIRITNGSYNSSTQILSFEENGVPKSLNINGETIRGQRVFKDRFERRDENGKKIKNVPFKKVEDFGNFEFDFYIFDFNAKLPSKYTIIEEAKNEIRKHRVYLLRDGIRVLPYGEDTDDWLQIDMMRGTISAGSFFSNDQLVGRVRITKQGNTHLKDKTNREGLIEDGDFTEDFICVIQSFLSYLRTQTYKIYLDNNKKKAVIEETKTKKVERDITELKTYFKDNKRATDLITRLERTYKTEHSMLLTRVQQTESLAAVGLSVETASHDIMLMYNRGIESLGRLIKVSASPQFDVSTLQGELEKLFGIFTFVQNQLKDMQKLFVSSKQSRKNFRVKEMIEKIVNIYSTRLGDGSIKCNIEEFGSPVMAKCTMADVLQVLINLMDNAIYWLGTIDREDKEILVTLDGNSNSMIFSDNGPGIKNEDKEYIFDPFFSGKGTAGRGLGLYIVNSILKNNEYSIYLADVKKERILCGANFVVSFVKDEENGY